MTGAKIWVVNIAKIIGKDFKQVILFLKGRLFFCDRILVKLK